MTEIRVPKLNNNDDVYTLIDWLVEDGKPVEADTPVAELETSKAVEELLCPAAGVLRHGVAVGWEGAPGEAVGLVADPGSAPEPTESAAPDQDTDGPIVTAPAQALIDEAGVDPSVIRRLGVKVVRRADVERVLAADSQVIELPAVQRAVARTVETSHRTIPAAYTVIQVDAGAVLEEAARLSARLRRIVGLTDFVVCAAARLHERFPGIFASPGDDGNLRPAAAAHIGVTVDVGRGLYVPVIPEASAKSLPEIVEAISGLRRTALSGTFREREFAGANLVVALHQDRDIVLAVPFVFPGQLCALALAGPRQELRLDGDGAVVARTVVNLGLAYDHRFVNGRDGNLFLQALKDTLEAPGELAPG